MKEILDVVVVVLFVGLLIFFIANFNKQQVQKHKDRTETKQTSSEDKTDA